MEVSRRQAFGLAGAAGALAAASPGLAEPASGPFTPDWASLVRGYRAPDWFRDAKLGL
jgi:alpha-L-fucosidase